MYLLLPKFDLRQLNGEYFEDRLLYLIMILEMAEERKIEDRNYYDYEVADREYPLPKDYEVLSNVAIRTKEWEQYDEEQLKEVRYKFPGFSLAQSVNYFNDFGVPFSKYFVFNDGKEARTAEERRGMPQLIPKIIHQVWIRGELPPMKAYFSKKTQEMYPDYEYKIWKQ
ncbi:unnamed protein product [Sphagnum balticum]